jgi:syndecan 1
MPTSLGRGLLRAPSTGLSPDPVRQPWSRRELAPAERLFLPGRRPRPPERPADHGHRAGTSGGRGNRGWRLHCFRPRMAGSGPVADPDLAGRVGLAMVARVDGPNAGHGRQLPTGRARSGSSDLAPTTTLRRAGARRAAGRPPAAPVPRLEWRVAVGTRGPPATRGPRCGAPRRTRPCAAGGGRHPRRPRDPGHGKHGGRRPQRGAPGIVGPAGALPADGGPAAAGPWHLAPHPPAHRDPARRTRAGALGGDGPSIERCRAHLGLGDRPLAAAHSSAESRG